MTTTVQKKSWWGRNWKWLVPVIVLVPIGVCGGGIALIATLVFGMMKSSVPYQTALQAAKTNQAVIAAIGEPIEAGFLVTGNIEVSTNSGTADLGIPINGPKGAGLIYVVAVKNGSTWQYNEMSIQITGTSERIDLLNGP